MDEKKLIYICKPYASVFESQVIEYLILLKKRRVFKEIILLLGVKDEKDFDIQGFVQKYSLDIKIFKLYPNYTFFKGIQYVAIRKKLEAVLDQNSIIHLRTELLSKAVYKVVRKNPNKNIKVITDVRGAVYEETLLYKSYNPLLKKLKLWAHRKNLAELKDNTDIISCVSLELKNYVIERTGIDGSKVFVNHCLAGSNFNFVDTVRSNYRELLGIKENEVLFLFSTGGGGNWQNTSDIISKIAEKGYRILNLSRQKIEHENVINLFVPYDEVPKYLNAVDIAIVWRDNNVVNQVASPVKFSEYVCSGLPVIANDGVCLIKNYIQITGFGELINSFDDINEEVVAKLEMLNREEISSKGRELYASKTIIDQYIKMYHQF